MIRIIFCSCCKCDIAVAESVFHVGFDVGTVSNVVGSSTRSNKIDDFLLASTINSAC